MNFKVLTLGLNICANIKQNAPIFTKGLRSDETIVSRKYCTHLLLSLQNYLLCPRINYGRKKLEERYSIISKHL